MRFPSQRWKENLPFMCGIWPQLVYFTELTLFDHHSQEADRNLCTAAPCISATTIYVDAARSSSKLSRRRVLKDRADPVPDCLRRHCVSPLCSLSLHGGVVVFIPPPYPTYTKGEMVANAHDGGGRLARRFLWFQIVFLHGAQTVSVVVEVHA